MLCRAAALALRHGSVALGFAVAFACALAVQVGLKAVLSARSRPVKPALAATDAPKAVELN